MGVRRTEWLWVGVPFVAWSLAVGGCAPDQKRDVQLARERIAQAPPPPPRVVIRPLTIAAVDTAPATGASPMAGASVGARALIITADGTNSAFTAIESTLTYLGTPYDVLNASTGPALTAAMLSTGSLGKYNAVFLDIGDLGGAFTDDEWATLTAYEVEFGVRRVSLYTPPNASYGLTGGSPGVDPSVAPIAATCTAAGKALFVGTNCANPIQINDGHAYPTAASDGATTPLLVDASGNVYAAIRSYPDGREALALTFGQADYYVSYLEIAYALVSWATHGVFVGERHVYAVPQIDDLFLSSAIYTGGTYRITDTDLQSFIDWQNSKRAQPVFAGFRAAWAVNGSGSQSRPGDPLTAKVVAAGSTFAWINHTWDHPVLDGLSYADVLNEFTQNDQYLRGLGLAPYATINAVTPNISGLGSADAMRAIHDAGIQQIVSDTSVMGEDNPSPNAGIWNALEPSVLEIPRKATDLYFNVTQAAEWIPEYEALNKLASVDYPTIIDVQSGQLFQYMLNGNNDPWMFHQANTRDYDGAGHSLLSDLLDAAFSKYAAVMTFPVVSPTMEDLATRVRNRMAFNAAGVSATIGAGTLTVTVAHAATVPVTGLCTSGAETYAGQSISYLTLADGQTATYPLGSCSTTVGAVGGAGSPDGGTASQAGDAGSANVSDAGPDAGTVVSGGSATAAGATDVSGGGMGCACALGADRLGLAFLPVALFCVVIAARRARRSRSASGRVSPDWRAAFVGARLRKFYPGPFYRETIPSVARRSDGKALGDEVGSVSDPSGNGRRL